MGVGVGNTGRNGKERLIMSNIPFSFSFSFLFCRASSLCREPSQYEPPASPQISSSNKNQVTLQDHRCRIGSLYVPFLEHINHVLSRNKKETSMTSNPNHDPPAKEDRDPRRDNGKKKDSVLQLLRSARSMMYRPTELEGTLPLPAAPATTRDYLVRILQEALDVVIDVEDEVDKGVSSNVSDATRNLRFEFTGRLRIR